METASARTRPERILEIADAILVKEGEQGLQMRDLARRASVSLATLYQHFPSKDHVLGAIGLARQRRVAERARHARFEGRTAGERAGEVMMRELRAVQQDPEMATGLQRVASAPDRATSEYIAGVRTVMEEMVLNAIAARGQPATQEQIAILPIFLSACYGAMNGWLSGIYSIEQAQSQIRIAQRLFDLPPDLLSDRLLSRADS